MQLLRCSRCGRGSGGAITASSARQPDYPCAPSLPRVLLLLMSASVRELLENGRGVKVLCNRASIFEAAVGIVVGGGGLGVGGLITYTHHDSFRKPQSKAIELIHP